MKFSSMCRAVAALALTGLLIAGPVALSTASAQTASNTTTTTAAAPAAAPAPAPAPAAAPAPFKTDSGDTAWMLTSTALVLMMTIPGLALFYGGMVRKKNVIATVTQSFAMTAVVTIVWAVATYSLAFSSNPDPTINAYIGGFSNFGLKAITMDKT